MPLLALVVGTTAGGLLAGAGVALTWLVLDSLEGARPALVIGVGAVTATAVAVPAVADWVPERPRQVPSALLMAAPWRAALRWGVELGTGVATFVVTPALYALFAIAIGQDDPAAALLLCGVYGFARGVVIGVFAIRYSRAAACPTRLPGAGLKAALRLPLIASIVVAGLAALA